MKILFGAQGGMLKVLQEIDKNLRSQQFLTESAYWVSDAEYYYNKIDSLPLRHVHNIPMLFEWEYTKGKKISSERVQAILAKYASCNLWDAVVSDRRLMFGKDAKYRQQYACKFTDNELYNIVLSSLIGLDDLVGNFRPDAILTFVPATYGDYLLYYVAKVNKIEYRQLRSTKIANYMVLSKNFGASSSEIDWQCQQNMNAESYNFSQEAEEYIQKAAAAPMLYEGSLKKSHFNMLNYLKALSYNFLVGMKKQFSPGNRLALADNHVPPSFSLFLYSHLLAPINKWRADRTMGRRMVDLAKAKGMDYVFFPLHSEPEIAISVNGRNCQNQIETIRRIAQSVPLGWSVIVKEHPRSFSYRTPGYYRRILEIPNVYFAEVEVQPYYWVKYSKAVTTISGFVGFEAVVIGKPVIVLGDVMFDKLPRTMLRVLDSFSNYHNELINLVDEYQYDKKNVKAFVAACMDVGVPINMYSVLLSKPGRVSMDSGDNINSEYERISEYFRMSLERP